MTLAQWRRKYELVSGPYGLVRGVVESMSRHAYEDASSMRMALVRSKNVR